jgi:hypothetical protein
VLADLLMKDRAKGHDPGFQMTFFATTLVALPVALIGGDVCVCVCVCVCMCVCSLLLCLSRAYMTLVAPALVLRKIVCSNVTCAARARKKDQPT